MTPRKALARSGTGIPVLALAASMLVALAMVGCGSKAADNAEGAGMPPPPEVSVATVLSKEVRQWDEFTGRVVAVETVELRPRVSGYVERVAFKEGQEVRKGDLLFVIDQRTQRSATGADAGCTCAGADRSQGDLARGIRNAQGRHGAG